MDWFPPYDNGLHRERVKQISQIVVVFPLLASLGLGNAALIVFFNDKGIDK